MPVTIRNHVLSEGLYTRPTSESKLYVSYSLEGKPAQADAYTHSSGTVIISLRSDCGEVSIHCTLDQIDKLSTLLSTYLMERGRLLSAVAQFGATADTICQECCERFDAHTEEELAEHTNLGFVDSDPPGRD